MKTFAAFVISLCALMPLLDVARLLGIGWDRAKRIHMGHLQGRARQRRLKHVRRIGIDEFALRKGHNYMTTVVDLDSGEIIEAHEGKDADSLLPFLRRLKRSRARLQAVAMDMSAAFLRAVREVFGDSVAIVHDRYHVVALANKAVDDTRRDVMRDLEGNQGRGLKRTRYLWLKGAENLDEEALERLQAELTTHQPLFEAWTLKEMLRDFWELADREIGTLFLDAWLAAARAAASAHIKRLANTLDRHRDSLLAFFEHRITNACTEGLNNKVKVLKRQAYGFRDMEYFRLRLYFLHEAKLGLTA